MLRRIRTCAGSSQCCAALGAGSVAGAVAARAGGALEPDHVSPLLFCIESKSLVKIHFTSCLRDTDKDLVSHASQKALNDSVAELADLDCQMHTKILSLRAYIYEVVEPSLPCEHDDTCLQSFTLAIMPNYDITPVEDDALHGQEFRDATPPAHSVRALNARRR